MLDSEIGISTFPTLFAFKKIPAKRGKEMEENSSEYIKKRLQDLIDGQVRSQRKKALDEIEAGMTVYRAELKRLEEYASEEEIDNLEKSLHQTIFMPKNSFERGSFMEFAAPFMGFIEKSIPELSKRVESLKAQNSTEYKTARDYFLLLEDSIKKFDDTPIRKLRDAELGKELLSAIWADIHALHVSLSDNGAG